MLAWLSIKRPIIKDTNDQERLLMFCRHCGHEVKDKAVICSNCGTPINEASEAPEVRGSRWSWFTMLVTLAVVTLLLLIAIIAGL